MPGALLKKMAAKPQEQQPIAPILSRQDKVKTFKYTAERANFYFQSRDEQSIIPVNF